MIQPKGQVKRIEGLYLWTYRDQPKHGYHLDTDSQSANTLREIILSLGDGSLDKINLKLGTPSKKIMIGPNIGRQPKPFQNFVLESTHDRNSPKNTSIFTAEDVTISIKLDRKGVQEFVSAIDLYISGEWDFSFENLFFWPYTKMYS